MIRVGYVCVNTQLPSSARTLRLANVTPERLCELIGANLDALEVILRWNEAHGVQVFRLTSNLIRSDRTPRMSSCGGRSSDLASPSSAR